VLVTQGDAAGIGPELIAMAFRDAPQRMAGCAVAGDLNTLRRAAAVVGGMLPTALLGDGDALAADPHALAQAVAQVPPRCIPVVQACAPCATADLPEWGRVSGAAGRMAADCIAWAARAALHGRAAALVTAPIHKEALAAAGVPHPGHTELLQALAAEHLGCPLAELPVRMMLSAPGLQTVLVSIHVSLREALDLVTTDRVLQTVRMAHAALTARDTALGRSTPPRLAVAGLNPHAGEGGLFGREELDHIAPAVALARAEGLDVQGPLPPDTVFMQARQGRFDAVVAMYHDQGLIPVKLLGVEHGVNVTLGLPLVRASPDHGTAFDLAGTGRADPSSLLAAVDWVRGVNSQ
jgi:4-hydroxythreonine-4-phosphate dehydrogenase